MKRCPTSLIIGEMSIKAKQYHFVPIQLSKTKWSDNRRFLWEAGTVILEGV